MHRGRVLSGNVRISVGRRSFLAVWPWAIFLWAVAASLTPTLALPAAEPSGVPGAAAPVPTFREITLTSTHTHETITARYFVDGRYDPVVLGQLNHVLRDHRNNEQGVMDPPLFDYLFDVASAAGVAPDFEVISGFRSPASNEMLRQRGSGVAQKSQHLLGKAIDVRLRGVDTARVRDIALALKRGGVGYYRKSDFVHLDTGRVRRWNGQDGSVK